MTEESHLREVLDEMSVTLRPPRISYEGVVQRGTTIRRGSLIVRLGVSSLAVLLVVAAVMFMTGNSTTALLLPRAVDGRVVLPVAFPDGERVDISYAPTADLASMDIAAGIRLRLTEGPWEGCGALIELVTDPKEIHGGGDVIEVYPGSSRVELWRVKGPAAEALVFEASPWFASIPFSANDACPSIDVAETWARSVNVAVDATGLPVVAIKPPADFDSGYIGGHGLPEIMFTSTEGQLSFEKRPCSTAEEFTRDTQVSRCFHDSVLVTMNGSQAFLATLASSLSVTEPVAS